MKKLLLFGFLNLAALPLGAGPFPPQAELDVLETTTPNAYVLEWPSVAGRLYIVQTSPDLVTWDALPLIKLGDGLPMYLGFSVGGNRLYFRLRYTLSDGHSLEDAGDADFDGVSNILEIGTHFTDPFQSSDPDGDGVAGSVDKLPYDPSASQHAATSLPDTTAPVIDLTSPTNAAAQP
jgi:hypothetical protein